MHTRSVTRVLSLIIDGDDHDVSVISEVTVEPIDGVWYAWMSGIPYVELYNVRCRASNLDLAPREMNRIVDELCDAALEEEADDRNEAR